MTPFNVRLRESNWEAVHGPRAFRRGQHMRAMAYDIAELVHAHRMGMLTESFCVNYLWHNLSSAYFTFAWHWWAGAHGSPNTITTDDGNVIETEQLLDRAKGEIEYKLPMITALYGYSRSQILKLINALLLRLRDDDQTARRWCMRADSPESKFDLRAVPLRVMLDFATWVVAAASSITENVDDQAIQRFAEP